MENQEGSEYSEPDGHEGDPMGEKIVKAGIFVTAYALSTIASVILGHPTQPPNKATWEKMFRVCESPHTPIEEARKKLHEEAERLFFAEPPKIPLEEAKREGYAKEVFRRCIGEDCERCTEVWKAIEEPGYIKQYIGEKIFHNELKNN